MSLKLYNVLMMMPRLLVCSTALFLPATAVAAQTSSVSAVDGTWVGEFAQASWTLEFRYTDKGWTGRYMSSKYNKWHDLQSLVISDNSVRFNIKAQPSVTFTLALDSSNKSLSGDVAIGNGATVPFSASRKV